MKEEVFIISKESIKLIANNKKAYHDYFIDDKWEAGIELFGTEVKSCLLYTSAFWDIFWNVLYSQSNIRSLWWTVVLAMAPFVSYTASAQ